MRKTFHCTHTFIRDSQQRLCWVDGFIVSGNKMNKIKNKIDEATVNTHSKIFNFWARDLSN